MKLYITPGAGIGPTISSIRQARKTVDILIFRLDRREVTAALAAAVARGVFVRALIAHTNRGGARSLRKLEMRLLEAGVTVSRTADDLVRYHGKMLIVDGRILHIHGFNFTWLDIEKSRSFGIVTRNRHLVQEAIKLFEADSTRQPYTPGYSRLVVSPETARERLTAFIKAARAQLLIYDPEVSDSAMLRLLADRRKAGVDVRVIGKIRGASTFTVERYPGTRLHVRAIIRDGRRAFLGSQSLRRFELDRRREIGVIIDDPDVVIGMRDVFEQDWLLTETGQKAASADEPKRESPQPSALEASA
jgi:cardiolipin synthase